MARQDGIAALLAVAGNAAGKALQPTDGRSLTGAKTRLPSLEPRREYASAA